MRLKSSQSRRIQNRIAIFFHRSIQTAQAELEQVEAELSRTETIVNFQREKADRLRVEIAVLREQARDLTQK